MLKEEGLEVLNLGGVSEENPGLREFKAGFGAANDQPSGRRILLRDLAKTVHDWCSARSAVRARHNACDIRTESARSRRSAGERSSAMETAKLLHVVGARPNFPKLAGPSRG